MLTSDQKMIKRFLTKVKGIGFNFKLLNKRGVKLILFSLLMASGFIGVSLLGLIINLLTNFN